MGYGKNLERQYPDWASWKSACITRGLPVQFQETDTGYEVWGYDGPECHTVVLWKNPAPAAVLGNDPGVQQAIYDAERLDFEANFKPYGNKAVEPRASDGKPFTLPNIFPGEVLLNFAGAGDQLDPPLRYGGPLFQMEVQGGSDATFDIDFLDGIFLAGGHVEWEGGSPGSYVEMTLHAPATVIEDAPQDLGDCVPSPTGAGFNIIVPAVGGPKKLVSGVPVPAYDDETGEQNGRWNYTEPWVGKGSLSAGVAGAAKYNLFDAPLKLAVFAKLALPSASGQRDLASPSIKPKWVLPEWKMRVAVHNADASKTLRLSWDLLIARRKSA